MAFPTAVTMDLTSSTTGDYSFSLSSGGPTITSCTLPAGAVSLTLFYTGYKVETSNPNLKVTVLSSIANPSVSQAIAVSPAAYSKLQVLLPNQVSDPGKPFSDPLGRIGTPNSVEAGSFVTATVNAVDKYFNLISTIIDTVNFTTSDAAAPPEGSANLTGGIATHPVVFLTEGGQTLTATDPNTAPPSTGTSDTITILPGVNSTLLNVVHGSPNLSTVTLGENGVEVLTFNLSVQQGTDAIKINSLTLNAEDQDGVGVAMDTAFQNLILTGGALPITVNTSLIGPVTAVFPGPITVNAGSNSLALTVTADILANASAKTVRLSLGKTGIVAQDASVGSPVGFTTFGDSTGFPMNSNLMLFRATDVTSTYGNYPNPFHPGQGSTTIEFNLQSASTVSLVLYDVMGERTATLIDNQTLQAGLQRVSWDGRNGMGAYVLNGIYYAQLIVDGPKYMLKIAVVR